jgi:hypothetical protein
LRYQDTSLREKDEKGEDRIENNGTLAAVKR